MPPRLRRALPFLAWPEQWRRHGLRGDVVAGITVALVCVPQALAYAQLAGMPPHVGLYAALLPMVVGTLFGSCAQLSTGPVALTALLTGATLAPLAPTGSAEFVALAILLSVLSGVIQLSLGGLRLGWLMRLLSHPVLLGFINASALIICLSQLAPLLGLSLPHSGRFIQDVWQALSDLDHPHLPSLAFGLGALATLIGLRRLDPRLPGVLIVVIAATLLSALSGFAALGGKVVGDIPLGLPTLAWPAVDWARAADLLPAAFVVALVSFMEAASSAKLLSARLNEPWNENQELIGQGLAKLAGALSGTHPVSSSFSRSALNYSAGARSGLAGLITATLLVPTLFWLTPLLWHLPVPVLSAVILLAVAGLIDPRELRRAGQASRDDKLAAWLTFGATLLFAPNIHNGLLAGLLLSLALMLYRGMHPRVALLGLHADGTYRDLARFGLRHPSPHVVIMRFDGPLTFVTAESFEDAVQLAQHAQADVRAVLVAGAAIHAVDATGAHVLTRLHERFAAQGRTLAHCGLKKQAIDVLERTGLWPHIALHATYRTEEDALAALIPLTDGETTASGQLEAKAASALSSAG